MQSYNVKETGNICGSGGKVAFSGFLLTFRFKHKIIKTCRQLLTVVGTNLSDLFG